MKKTALEYYKSGIMKDLFLKGIVTAQVFNRFEIYECYVKNCINNAKSEAIRLTSEEHRVCEKTVRRAIKTAES